MLSLDLKDIKDLTELTTATTENSKATGNACESSTVLVRGKQECIDELQLFISGEGGGGGGGGGAHRSR